MISCERWSLEVGIWLVVNEKDTIYIGVWKIRRPLFKTVKGCGYLDSKSIYLILKNRNWVGNYEQLILMCQIYGFGYSSLTLQPLQHQDYSACDMYTGNPSVKAPDDQPPHLDDYILGGFNEGFHCITLPPAVCTTFVSLSSMVQLCEHKHWGTRVLWLVTLV